MKTTKRIITALLATCMMASFAACGGSAPAADPPPAKPAGTEEAATPTDGATITFTMQKYGKDASSQDNVLKEITQKFKEETGITVKYSLIDWSQALTKLTLACTGGEAPDVADVFFTSSMVQMGQGKFGPMDVTSEYEALGGDEAYFNAAVEEVRVDGKVYGIPWRMDTRMMAYNVEHFEEAGITEVPTTYDELMEVAQKLTKVDDKGNITRSGMVWPVGQARFDQPWFILLAGHGERVMSDDYSAFTFNNDKGKASLQLMIDAVNVYKVCTSNLIDPSFDASTEFMAEKASIICGVNGDFKTAIDEQAPQLKGKYASAVMPNLTGEGVSSIAFAAPICVMNTTKEKDASSEWLKYFCSPDVQLQFSKAVNLISSNKAVMADAFYTDDPFMANLPKQAERAVQGDPPVPTWSQIDAFPNGPINTMVTNIFAGNDIQAEMDKCQKDSEKIFKGE